MSGHEITITISGHGGEPVALHYKTCGTSEEALERFIEQVCHSPLPASIETELRRRLGLSREKKSERRALIQGDYFLPRGTRGREPGTVAWPEHEKAWAAYAKRYGNGQSAERINERGGFGYSEITALLGDAPRTWTEGR